MTSEIPQHTDSKIPTLYKITLSTICIILLVAFIQTNPWQLLSYSYLAISTLINIILIVYISIIAKNSKAKLAGLLLIGLMLIVQFFISYHISLIL